MLRTRINMRWPNPLILRIAVGRAFKNPQVRLVLIFRWLQGFIHGLIGIHKI